MTAIATNSRAAQMVAGVKKEIEEAKSAGWNVLIAEDIRPASEMFLPHLSIVRLDPDKDSGDFYYPSDANGKARLTYNALKKLAAEAGIQWVPEQEGIVQKEENYVAFKAVGRRFTSSGEVRMLAGFSDKDMLIKEEELRAKTGNDKKSEGQIAAELRKERSFWMRKAESGARGRVIKGFIPVKAAYTKEQAAKPFVILRYIFSPDMRDAVIKTHILNAATQAVSGVFGPQAAQYALPQANGEVHEADFRELDPAAGSDIPEAGDAAEQPGLEIDFQNQSAEEQVTCLRSMIQSTGYDIIKRPASLMKQAELYTAAERLEFYRILSALQAPATPAAVGF
jgi:hypothetical protein